MAVNFPSFFPLIYHDIALEIPTPFQGLARRYYYGWQFLIFGGSFFSIIASIIFWAALNSSAGAEYNTVLAGTALSYIGQRIVNLLLFPTLYFWILYWPLYKALKKNNSIAWLVFGINNLGCLTWLCVLLSGVWPGDLNWYWISNAQPLGTIFGIVSIVDKGIWMLCLLWWVFSSMKAYMVYMYEAGPVHAKLASQKGTELDKVSKTATTVPSKRPAWGTTAKVAGQDVNVSVDGKTAASVAGKAYSSGAAGQLAAGTKPKMGADGKMTFEVDPNAAKQAAGTMYKSGAASELAAGTTVSSGGWGWGGSKTAATVPSGPPSRVLKVIHDFTGQEQGDLSIKAGDRVTFVRQVDENWIEGTLNGQKGIFPSKFASDV